MSNSAVLYIGSTQKSEAPLFLRAVQREGSVSHQILGVFPAERPPVRCLRLFSRVDATHPTEGTPAHPALRALGLPHKGTVGRNALRCRAGARGGRKPPIDASAPRKTLDTNHCRMVPTNSGGFSGIWSRSGGPHRDLIRIGSIDRFLCHTPGRRLSLSCCKQTRNCSDFLIWRSCPLV